MIDRAYDQMVNYLRYLEKRGRKTSSLTCYRSALRNFIGYLESTGRCGEADKIGEEDITAFVHGYIASEQTVRYYIDVVSGWMRYYNNRTLDEMGLLWNKTGTPNARWVKTYEFRKILEGAEDMTDRMILILSAYGGMRRAEMSELKVTDIEDDRIRILGKGHGLGKVRYIPLSPILREAVERYKAYRERILSQYKDQTDGRLLFSFVGKAARRLSPETVGRHARACAVNVGIDATTHSMRRLFATALYDHDIDIKSISQLLGHESTRTTEKYIKRDNETLKNAISILSF